MEYGYVRVSTTTQNVDRQLDEMFKQGLDEKQIYIDKQSGKDFERPNYQKMKKRLKENDLLIIKSIDRLGRNYEMIIEEWSSITKDIKADIVVLDFPLLDTRTDNKNLVGKFISDIVLQVLSFVAQNERENIRQRQAEGIKNAKEKGIHMGRPPYQITSDFIQVFKSYCNKEITSVGAASLLNISRGTFIKYAKRCKKEIEI